MVIAKSSYVLANFTPMIWIYKGVASNFLFSSDPQLTGAFSKRNPAITKIPHGTPKKCTVSTYDLHVKFRSNLRHFEFRSESTFIFSLNQPFPFSLINTFKPILDKLRYRLLKVEIHFKYLDFVSTHSSYFHPLRQVRMKYTSST